MRKLVAHCYAPQPASVWIAQLTAAGFQQLDSEHWRHGAFIMRLEIEEEAWLQGEGQSLAPEAVTALLRVLAQVSAGGELELFEEDGRLLQRHGF